jgi:Fungal Zn(2)-Cys(6) binuclear cluster domain
MSASPEQLLIPSGQKRPRPIQSCLPCRSKKLRCDRQLPCSQCVKGRRTERCNYNEHAESLLNTKKTSPGSKKRRLEGPELEKSHVPAHERVSTSNHTSTAGDISQSNGDSGADGSLALLQERVSKLENLLNGPASAKMIVQARPENEIPLLGAENLVTSKDQGLKSRFHGLGNTRSLINQVRFYRTF